MKTIAVFCGGDSSEREVSIHSALNTLSNIDRQKYNPYLHKVTVHREIK